MIDIQTDKAYTELSRLSQLYSWPAYVKQAAAAEATQTDRLPDNAFADASRRLYPCHTKTACYLSAMYFLEHQSELPVADRPVISRRLEKAAKALGIVSDLQSLRQEHDRLHKTAVEDLPDSDFALVRDAGDGNGKLREYPLRNAKEVQAAAVWLQTYRDDLLFSERHAIAGKILHKAAEYSAALNDDLDDFLRRQAGEGFCDPVKVAQMLFLRSRQTHVPAEARIKMAQLADVVKGNPMIAQDPTALLQLAGTVDTYDKTFAVKYGSDVSRPEDVIFGGLLKHAEQVLSNACQTLSGSMYDKSQFKKLSLQQVRAEFGDSLADAVASGGWVDGEKMAEVATTLPLPDARRLDALMLAAGEPAVMKKNSSVGMTPQERNDLAKLYQFANSLPAAENSGPPTGLGGSRVVGGLR